MPALKNNRFNFVQQYGFAIHTSSPDLGFAIALNMSDCRHSVWELGRDLATHLHFYLAEFLLPQTWSDLAFLAVARGPGSFTGTRLGVVTARTLAQQLNIPLFGVSTLAAIAWAERANIPAGQAIAVQMRAQRGKVFGAIYQPGETSLKTILPDTVMSPARWQQTLEQEQIPLHLLEAEASLGYTTPSLLDLAYQRWRQGQRPLWRETLPFYGQHPVGE